MTYPSRRQPAEGATVECRICRQPSAPATIPGPGGVSVRITVPLCEDCRAAQGLQASARSPGRGEQRPEVVGRSHGPPGPPRRAPRPWAGERSAPPDGLGGGEGAQGDNEGGEVVELYRTPQEPPPAPCRGLVNQGEPCPNMVRAGLVQLKYRASHWTYEPLCDDCKARAARAEAVKEYRDAQLKARIPPKYRALRLDDPGEGGALWLPDDVEMAEVYTERQSDPHRLIVCGQNSHVVRVMRRWKRTVIDGLTHYGASFVLHGPVGTGKTALLAAFINRQIWARVSCLWLTEADLLASQQRPRPGQANPAERWLEEACRVPVLALDELGADVKPHGTRRWERESPAAQLVEQVVRARYEKNLPVFFTTNLSTKQVAEVYGQRLFSRLAEMTNGAFLELGGYSWRTGKPIATVALDEAEPTHSPVRDGRALAAGDARDEEPSR